MASSTAQDSSYDTAIAIVGMSGRFPGAHSVDAFWQNVVHGVKSIRFYSEEELVAAGIEPALIKHPNYVLAGAPLDDVALFDATFFGFTPREAAIADPQHRLFLECAWEAFENAGYDSARYSGLVGVYGGEAFGTYFVNNLFSNPYFMDTVGPLQIGAESENDSPGPTYTVDSDHISLSVSTTNDRDGLASLVSYKMNLKGPSLTLQTFCSTSLVAIHVACQSLLNFECDMALAGASAIAAPHITGYVYKEGGIVSPDGQCRAFDAHAQGSVMGNGVGVVLLKRLEDALADRDTIHAVIRGSAMNNDGGTRVSYTAPSIDGQSEVIAEALGNANVAAETISYIEAHGTGTPLGDAVELTAMKKAFARSTKQQGFCAIGSVKPNVGHLDRASGVTGLIKATQALRHKILPASLNFESANPEIDLEHSPFYVNTTSKPWPGTTTPRRAGVSSFGLGGTNAHVVLEEAPERLPSCTIRRSQLLLLSAKTEIALAAATYNLANHLQANPELELADVAYTLQVGRSAFNHRQFVLSQDSDDAVPQLQIVRSTHEHYSHQTARNKAVSFFFPDTVAQECLLKDTLSHLGVAEPRIEEQIEHVVTTYNNLRSAKTTPSVRAELEQITDTYILTFALEHALALQLLHWGIQPQTLIGHGIIGECVAACIAGIFSLEDALLLMVRLHDLSRLQGATETHQTSLMQGITLHDPHIPFCSSQRGMKLSSQQATDSSYWESHLQFVIEAHDKAAPSILQNESLFVEVGLSSATNTSTNSTIHIIQLSSKDVSQAYAHLLTALGKLWLAGVDIDWAAFHDHEERQRVALPTYPFERKHYWIQPPHAKYERRVADSATPRKKTNIDEWFYLPEWKQVPLGGQKSDKKQTWLILGDELGAGEQVAQRAKQDGHTIFFVHSGKQFARNSAESFTIRPGESSDYITLLQSIGTMPQIVLHCWSYTSEQAVTEGVDYFQVKQRNGFFSLLYLTQAVSAQAKDGSTHIVVASNHIQRVTGKEELHPEKATILGACKIIPQEYLNMTCRCVDLEQFQPSKFSSIADMLFFECTNTVTSTDIAYRNGKRWQRVYTPTRIKHPATSTPVFRKNGVYLITGGLGHIGLTLAEHLAKTVQAHLVLIGRNFFPAKNRWNEWLAEHEHNERTSVVIRRIQVLEQLGSKILILQADVADVDQLQSTVTHAYSEFGGLHGVIHAAGITNETAFKAIQHTSASDCETHFMPKVYGLLALEKALRNRKLDFCIAFSSISTVLGGLGFSAYTAANSFMDAFIEKHSSSATFPWLSVDWDMWGVASDAQQQHATLGKTVAEYAMSTDEGCAALTRALEARHVSHLVHSTGNLQERIRQWVFLDALHNESSETTDSTGDTFTGCASKSTYEQKIREIWQQVLGVEQVGLHDNFFDLGGNSLIALQVISRLKKAFHQPVPAVALFEAPTISALVTYLHPEPETKQEDQRALLNKRRARARSTVNAPDIAIIGMTGRFPGAASVEQFWDNLRNGVESITFFTPDELLKAGIDPALLHDPSYVRARPVLSDEQVQHFDASFFGYSPREAELMDPQHRLFLECAWEVMERAGYDTSTYPGRIGVFAGSSLSTYALMHLNDVDLNDPTRNYQMVIGNDKDSLTTMVSYKLHLTGPSFAVQTFCSTSLVATHLACQSILHGECDLALAGGVSVHIPSRGGHLYQDGGMESPDGHCRTFDAQAKGTLFGDGVGIIALKRLEDALADGDCIQAVIKGSAINNDGSLKVSYTAPSVSGQADVVMSALENAGVSAESISYIEAHGTATELGDPIEVAALTKAYRTHTQQTGYCALGSVKTNVGHLDRAAGVSGLIKTVLALRHEEIPATLHYQTPNPEIDFEHSPFYVNAALRPWVRGEQPRRAGINSLGMGGTNVHVIVEEAPLREPSSSSRPWQPLVLSARNEKALRRAREQLAEYLRTHEEVPLADVAYTLQVGRRRWEHRTWVASQDREQAIGQLTDGASPTQVEPRTDRPVAFLFPGVGEQYVGLGKELYQQEETFRLWFDRCCRLLHPMLDVDLRTLLFPATSESTPTRDSKALFGRAPERRSEAEEAITRTRIAHPLVFALEYALAQQLMQWGIRPQAMLGYSVGEYVAACVAGVLSLEDALHLVARRAQLLEQHAAGVMVAVMLGEQQARAYTSEQVSLAAINTESLCVLAGPEGAIALVEQELHRREIACRRVEATHAFHSGMVEPARDAVTDVVRGMQRHEPQISYLSNVTGTWITGEQATDAEYWGQHMCGTVRFAEGVSHLLREGEWMLIEVGAGQGLSSWVKQHRECTSERGQRVIATMPGRYEKQSELEVLARLMARVWEQGVAIEWEGYYAAERRQRVVLPTYPFERQRYWLETNKSSSSIPPIKNEEKKVQDIANWFYQPSWKQGAALLPLKSVNAKECWLLFLDSYGVGISLRKHLLQIQQDVITVTVGNLFYRSDEYTYILNPMQPKHYELLLKDICHDGKTPQHIVHLWTVTTNSTEIGQQLTFEAGLQLGFYSLVSLAQGLSNLGIDTCRLDIISNDMQNVTGNERLCPEKATLLGPCKVIPQEFPAILCRSIDISLPTSVQEERFIGQLMKELTGNVDDEVVALRGMHRWLQCFEPMHIEPSPSENLPFRERGVYLITGGFGGIGSAIAEHLAHTVKAKLVLVSRTGLPAREYWRYIQESKDSTSSMKSRIELVERLEALGSEVVFLQADVANSEQMQEVIQTCISRFGALNGVIHAAGTPASGLIQRKTLQMATDVLAPKVKGTLVLAQVLKNVTLDFLVLFSSMSSITGGGPGQVDYCAANAFLDAFAQRHFSEHGVTLALDWGEWQWDAWAEGLAGYPQEARDYFTERRQQYGISFEEGMDALQRALSRSQPQLVVSTEDFQRQAAHSRHFSIDTIMQQLQEVHAVHIPTYSRPALSTPYIEPQDDIEKQLAELWRELLGIEQIGSADNFFELGGHSLMGTQLISRLRRIFEVNIRLTTLFEAPTIAELAVEIELLLIQEIDKLDEEEVQQLI